MKLLPPVEPHVLYKEGFGEADLLQRREAGKRLSRLLEDLDDPVVVALDGRWGSGKSYFLRRWVGAHTVENGGKATVIYFDAFANDYLEEPLIALTAAIGERLPQEDKRVSWRKAKHLAFKLAMPALRVGLATVTAGVSEAGGAVIAAAAEAGSSDIEAAADAFWKREEGRQAAMVAFGKCLSDLTVGQKEAEPKRLIIVVDELDRCRPDYALGLLEVMKHFFQVPFVHFVLGTNLEALEHSVRARYGATVDASDYLKRFITVTMALPNQVGLYNHEIAALVYFDRCAERMGLQGALPAEVRDQLELRNVRSILTLRDVEKLLSRMVLFPSRRNFHAIPEGYRYAAATLLLMQTLRPDLFSRAFAGLLTPSDVHSFLGIDRKILQDKSRCSTQADVNAYAIGHFWSAVLDPDNQSEELIAQSSRLIGRYPQDGAFVADVLRRYFGLFELNL